MRKDLDRDSRVLRTDPASSVMLLMAPPAPCGSFLVYGGWVGGPGREGDVKLVRGEERRGGDKDGGGWLVVAFDRCCRLSQIPRVLAC